jgi:hypothetical protein
MLEVITGCGRCKYIYPDRRGWSQGECDHPKLKSLSPEAPGDGQTKTLNNSPDWCPLHKESTVIMSDKRLKMVAQPVDGVLLLQSHETLPDGVKVLTTACVDYDANKNLPKVVFYENALYGKTGWNSDKHIAYYRTDAQIALVK